MKTISLQQMSDGFYRAIIIQTVNGLRVVVDVVEARMLADVNSYVTENHPDLTHARINGEDIVPDELSILEAVEAAL